MDFKLRAYRKASGLTQAQLADKLGKSFRTIQQWEQGESYPNAETLAKLCEIFNCSPNQMLGWVEPDLTSAEKSIVAAISELKRKGVL